MAAFIPAPSWVDSSKMGGANVTREDEITEDATAKLGLREDETGALIQEEIDDEGEKVQLEVREGTGRWRDTHDVLLTIYNCRRTSSRGSGLYEI
jgi:hypothetical protein